MQRVNNSISQYCAEPRGRKRAKKRENNSAGGVGSGWRAMGTDKYGKRKIYLFAPTILHPFSGIRKGRLQYGRPKCEADRTAKKGDFIAEYFGETKLTKY